MIITSILPEKSNSLRSGHGYNSIFGRGTRYDHEVFQQCDKKVSKRKFWGLVPTITKVIEAKLAGGDFFTHPSS